MSLMQAHAQSTLARLAFTRMISISYGLFVFGSNAVKDDPITLLDVALIFTVIALLLNFLSAITLGARLTARKLRALFKRSR